MRLHVLHMNMPSLAALDSCVDKQSLALGRARQIDEANVLPVRLQNASPAFQVHLHLVTLSSDVFAESRDHTLRAAFAKVMAQLTDTITSRATNRQQRSKGNRSARRHG